MKGCNSLCINKQDVIGPVLIHSLVLSSSLGPRISGGWGTENQWQSAVDTGAGAERGDTTHRTVGAQRVEELFLYWRFHFNVVLML